jgi:hypothetical protein
MGPFKSVFIVMVTGGAPDGYPVGPEPACLAVALADEGAMSEATRPEDATTVPNSIPSRLRDVDERQCGIDEVGTSFPFPGVAPRRGRIAGTMIDVRPPGRVSDWAG